MKILRFPKGKFGWQLRVVCRKTKPIDFYIQTRNKDMPSRWQEIGLEKEEAEKIAKFILKCLDEVNK